MGVGQQELLSLGARIREIRKQRGLSIRQVAERAGLSASLVSLIERNKANPSVGTLAKLASVLGVRVAELFDSGASGNPEGPVVRKEQRKRLHTSLMGVTHQLLVPDLNRKMELVYSVYDPKSWSGDVLMSHEGEECAYVVKGLMEVVVNGVPYILREGDTIYFDCSLPHQVKNIGDGPLEVIWVITPPTF